MLSERSQTPNAMCFRSHFYEVGRLDKSIATEDKRMAARGQRGGTGMTDGHRVPVLGAEQAWGAIPAQLRECTGGHGVACFTMLSFMLCIVPPIKLLKETEFQRDIGFLLKVQNKSIEN